MWTYLEQVDSIVTRYGFCLSEQVVDSVDVQVDSLMVGLVAGEGLCRGKAQENKDGVLHVRNISQYLGPRWCFWGGVEKKR